MRTVVATVGEGRLKVTCQLTTTDGQGLVAFVYGGERPHVGGQALAAPAAPIGERRLSSCDLWSATVPGHLDVEVAAAVARRLCLDAHEVVSCTVGIHVDGASAAEIDRLCSSALEAAQAALELAKRM